MGSFNTFGKSETTYKGGKNIWHEIRGKYPVGGRISNLSAFKGKVIPAGSMCVFDQAKKEIKIAKKTDVKTTANSGGTVVPNTILGLLENDIYVDATTTEATGTVVFDGSIYIDRVDEEIVPEVLAVLPMIVPIREKRS